MITVSPVDVYRKLTIGVAGTAMPQFEETLSPEDRWAVASYVATLRADDAMVREGRRDLRRAVRVIHGRSEEATVRSPSLYRSGRRRSPTSPCSGASPIRS